MKREFVAGMVNSFVPGNVAQLGASEREILKRRDAVLGPAYRLFYEEPVHIVRGQGVWLFDSAGKRYLDVYNNVASVGHCHPRVVAAICEQAAVLNTHTRYLHETIVEYAERLLATFPGELANVMFTCTGSESNDLAIRIAKAYTGAEGIIVTSLAYHGITDAVSKLSPSLGPNVPRGTFVRTVAAPDLYRSKTGDVGAEFASRVRDAIADLRSQGVRIAALVCDTIFSSDGILADPPGFLRGAVEAVRSEGGLFIADEVQAGFARTGTAMWGFQRHGVIPDIVTLGKPMGNGHPIAGVVVKPGVVEEFGRTARYFNTFGGNPVACAAALATLSVIEDDHLVENARVVGSYMRQRLEQLAVKHEKIGDVRGSGLFIGLELVRDRVGKEPDAELASHLVNSARRAGVLISATGPGANVLKIRPPLVFKKEHAEILVDTLSNILSA